MELRAYFRVDADIPMFVRQLKKNDAVNYDCNISGQGFNNAMKSKLCRRMNISGAGICFESETAYAPDDFLEIRFMLEGVHDGLIAISVQVLRVERRQKDYCIAVKYVSIDEQIRDLIIKFVFQRERILIQEKRVGWL
ncbi:MAG TPA: PilZ domain-containing protein [Dissulfurispiraceae bacterium]|nr:PilZ domain-containing protein [Dissulfurispiraceae bacterium]